MPGAVAVIGPMRMQYAHVAAQTAYVADRVGECLRASCGKNRERSVARWQRKRSLFRNPEQEANTEPAEESAKAAEKEKKKKKSEKIPKEDYDRLQAEFDSHKQQHLRVLAEYDNFRKRSANEKNAVYNNAVSDTINAILPVADNIDRALAQENASAEDMKKGVEMIASQFKASFEKLGIREVGQVGEPFDPALHNAVAHIESDELGENVISAVFQKGYMLGDKVVRHAMVQVAN